jgi:hypothetical protein
MHTSCFLQDNGFLTNNKTLVDGMSRFCGKKTGEFAASASYDKFKVKIHLIRVVEEGLCRRPDFMTNRKTTK